MVTVGWSPPFRFWVLPAPVPEFSKDELVLLGVILTPVLAPVAGSPVWLCGLNPERPTAVMLTPEPLPLASILLLAEPLGLPHVLIIIPSRLLGLVEDVLLG